MIIEQHITNQIVTKHTAQPMQYAMQYVTEGNYGWNHVDFIQYRS